VQSAPQAQFTIETTDISDGTNTNDAFTVTHDGGDTVESANVEMVVNDTVVYEDGAATGADIVTDGVAWGDEINAGGAQKIAEDSGDQFAEDDTVRVIWISPSSDKTQTLAKFTLG
jgi:hypothetical protein